MSDDSITITGLDPVLRAALDAEAARLGMSLNDLVVDILGRSQGLLGTTRLFRDLDGLAGRSVDEMTELPELEAVTRYLEEIDDSFGV